MNDNQSLNEGYVVGKVAGRYTEDWVKGASVGFNSLRLDNYRIKIYDVDYANGKDWSPKWVHTNGNGQFVLPFLWQPTDTGDVMNLFKNGKIIESEICIQTNVRSGTDMRHHTSVHPVQMYYFIDPTRVAKGLFSTSVSGVGKDVAKKVYTAIREMKVPTIKIAHPTTEWGILVADAGELEIMEL